MPKADAVFAIDGYEVSATFAEKRNQAALSQVNRPPLPKSETRQP